jgi:hypothetical protein
MPRSGAGQRHLLLFLENNGLRREFIPNSSHGGTAIREMAIRLRLIAKGAICKFRAILRA